MKKLLFILLFSGLFLAACGNEEPKDDDAMSQSAEFTEDQGELQEQEETSTDDPLLVADKNNEYEIFIDGFAEYKVIGRYSNSETDTDGFNTIEQDDFELRFAMLAIENIEHGDQQIGIFGEIINDTGDDYYFENVSIKTDQKEESQMDFAFNSAGKSDTREKVADFFNIEYDLPESFTLTILDPLYDDDDESNWNEDGTMKEPDVFAEIEFNKE